MATNLAGGVCIGELNACVVRAARLDSDCSPTGGADTGIVTAGLVTMNLDPDIEAGQVFRPRNACGTILYNVRQEDRIMGWNVSGEFAFFDYEMIALMFGHSTILGLGSGSFSGKVIGHASRLYNAAAQNGIYLEVIRQVATQDGGDCPQTSGVATPAAAGHIFGKAKLIPGAITFENDVARVTFTGYAQANNYLFNGPWNDYPGVGYIPNAPWVEIAYSTSEYNTILATIGCGFKTLPSGS